MQIYTIKLTVLWGLKVSSACLTSRVYVYESDLYIQPPSSFFYHFPNLPLSLFLHSLTSFITLFDRLIYSIFSFIHHLPIVYLFLSLQLSSLKPSFCLFLLQVSAVFRFISLSLLLILFFPSLTFLLWYLFWFIAIFIGRFHSIFQFILFLIYFFSFFISFSVSSILLVDVQWRSISSSLSAVLSLE